MCVCVCVRCQNGDWYGDESGTFDVRSAIDRTLPFGFIFYTDLCAREPNADNQQIPFGRTATMKMISNDDKKKNNTKKLFNLDKH